MVRRVLRYSQTDGRVSPAAIEQWLREPASRFVENATAVYEKSLREVGEGGGEEQAYLAHLVMLAQMRRSLDEQGVSPGWRAVMANVLMAGIEVLIEEDRIPSDLMSARLGLQFAASTSAFGLGATRDGVLSRLLNPYRTSRAVINKFEESAFRPFDTVSNDDFLLQLAHAVRADDKALSSVARMALVEMVRDCLLLAVVRGSNDPTLFNLANGVNDLEAVLFNAWQRDELELALDDAEDVEPYQTLRELVGLADEVLAGRFAGLKKHVALDERIRLAVDGGLALLMDEHVVKLIGTLESFIDWVDDAHLYREGRAYWIGSEDQPMYLLASPRMEGHLFVDVRDFTRRTSVIKERAMGDFLKRYFYEPVLAQAARRSSTVKVSNMVGDAVAFRGDIVAMVDLALAIRKTLDEAQNELLDFLPDIVGGSERLREITVELKRLERELLELGNERDEQLDARRKYLTAQLAMLEDSRVREAQRTVGEGLEAGAYVSYGPEAEILDIRHPTLGRWPVAIASALNEAARGTARAGSVRDYRMDLWLRAQRENPEAVLPFQVTVHESELYNAGSVLSEPALHAFRGAREGVFRFEEKIFKPADAPPYMRQYIFEHPEERFVVVYGIGDEVVHLLRHSGRVIFRGFETQGDVDLWELLLPESSFGRDLLSTL